MTDDRNRILRYPFIIHRILHQEEIERQDIFAFYEVVIFHFGDVLVDESIKAFWRESSEIIELEYVRKLGEVGISKCQILQHSRQRAVDIVLCQVQILIGSVA